MGGGSSSSGGNQEGLVEVITTGLGLRAQQSLFAKDGGRLVSEGKRQRQWGHCWLEDRIFFRESWEMRQDG